MQTTYSFSFLSVVLGVFLLYLFGISVSYGYVRKACSSNAAFWYSSLWPVAIPYYWIKQWSKRG